MESSKNETTLLPPPPSIIVSLKTGFDAVAGHITAILFPLVIDLFLWLGPRLRVDQLYAQFYKFWMDTAPGLGVTPEQISQFQSAYTPDFITELQRLNIFAILRTFPIGVSSLMAGVRPLTSPLGAPVMFQVGVTDLLVYILAFNFVGWILGALYFRWIANLVLTSDSQISVGHAIMQTLAYSLILSLLFWIFGMPIAFILSLLFMFNSLIGQAVLIFIGFVSMWLVVPIFFSSLGIFVRNQNAITSITSSFRTARFTMPSSSLFVLTILMIGVGLNFLWAIPSDDSWLMLIGILGHAFITTALLASSFVYYRDMTVWIQTVLEKMRSSLPTQQA